MSYSCYWLTNDFALNTSNNNLPQTGKYIEVHRHSELYAQTNSFKSSHMHECDQMITTLSSSATAFLCSMALRDKIRGWRTLLGASSQNRIWFEPTLKGSSSHLPPLFSSVRKIFKKSLISATIKKSTFDLTITTFEKIMRRYFNLWWTQNIDN